MPISAMKKFDRSKPVSVLALSRVTSQTGKMMTTLHTDVNTPVNNDLPPCNQAQTSVHSNSHYNKEWFKQLDFDDAPLDTLELTK